MDANLAQAIHGEGHDRVGYLGGHRAADAVGGQQLPDDLGLGIVPDAEQESRFARVHHHGDGSRSVVTETALEFGDGEDLNVLPAHDFQLAALFQGLQDHLAVAG